MSSPERRKEQQAQQQGQGAQRGQAQQQRGREGEKGKQGQQGKAEASQFSYEYMIPGYGAGIPQQPSMASTSGSGYHVPLTGGFAPSMGMGMGATAFGAGFPMQNIGSMPEMGAMPGLTGMGMASMGMTGARQQWATCHVNASLSELESIVSFLPFIYPFFTLNIIQAYKSMKCKVTTSCVSFC
jgi:hypothetical protein